MLVQISHSVSVFFSMMTLVIHLVMQSDVGADRSLSFLMYNATISNGMYEALIS